jgi:large subunit ribosomal protein L15
MKGGKGKAGGRKHFWIRTVKYDPDRYKKVGFKPPSALEPVPEVVNVGELQDLAARIFGAEKVAERGEELVLDLKSLGYGKLLGRGRIDLPLSVKISEYSSRALEKLESVGGQILEVE